MTDTPIPSPAELLRRHGLSPRKSWGQNFLHEREIHYEIVGASRAGPGRTVIEIGAGLGTLTAHLLATGARVEAIERDRDLCLVLRAELGGQPQFVLHEADAVRFDYAAVAQPLIDAGQSPPAVVGNLPYQLTGVLLFALLEHSAITGPWIVMVQREVADRLCAEPGSKRYGGVTAALSRVRRIARVCAVSRGCFLPPPRVDSAVIRLDPRPTPLGEVADPNEYLRLVRTCFQRRRKTLANALAGVAVDREQALRWIAAAEIDPKIRPERLGPAQFAALQRAREAEATASPDA
ncbi:16S rRNA (adenine(1518)-N(6)/adenine(1519)-N(6))-dimethyltransferase RsmA [Enhygromyxa salina]|uniref:Ribosomal RNA small subunit methyltransferase A n=1 Tax=Enhygromyxa salina TaxID=215803 RepID=A0A2S9YLI7_9BACT|nr:16S rRNA (adenine(1518)-N(6)/adenine(1519)-N(6))-dimethyltransferase RsmA [Enhygromyxa salina]PRQ05959.1 Ribosomal RNA small subunit methyltransferase A [Enhygromyxa salina]